MVDMDTIVSLCKRRGFVFPSSEIYGGLASTYDYGPLGVELKRNIRDSWWRTFIQGRDDCVGMESAILMHPQVWETSGHVASFSDPLVECRKCNSRLRPDQVRVSDVTTQDKGLIGYVSGFDEEELHKKWLDLWRRANSRPQLISISQRGPAQIRSLQDYLNDTSQIPCPACDAIGQFTEPRQFNLMFKTFLGP
ncbi:MAG: glycine--tRNA ligase, partial [Chloroflexi bacterium]|nr:glycine--tRNA ligase [Chloroflexota bacterium]